MIQNVGKMLCRLREETGISQMQLFSVTKARGHCLNKQEVKIYE